MRRRGGTPPKRYGTPTVPAEPQALDMLPIAAMDYPPDSVRGDGVVSRDASDTGPSRVTGANGDNIMLSHLGFRCGASTEAGYNKPPAPLAVTIPHVVGLGPCKKMLRIYARRIVAVVQREKLTERAMVCFVRHTMRRDAPIVFSGNAVSVTVDWPAPNPAAVMISRLFHLRINVTELRAKLLNPALALENCAALFARLFGPFFHSADYAPTRVARQGTPA